MEVKQLIREGIAQYFGSVGVIWNLLDLTSSSLVLTFIIMNLIGNTEDPNMYIIGGIGVFCLWLKLFYFMRMFQGTAAFVRMIVEMFIDIKVFMLIFFVGILAFSNTFYILDMYTKIEQSKETLETPVESRKQLIAGQTYLESFKYVYLQSLGELGFDGYDASYAPTVYWVFFFASSLFL